MTRAAPAVRWRAIDVCDCGRTREVDQWGNHSLFREHRRQITDEGCNVSGPCHEWLHAVPWTEQTAENLVPS